MATPSLSSVSPNSYTADANNHSMQLLGSNFQSGDTLTFVDPQGNIFASNSSKLTFISGGEIDYQFNDGSDAGTWTVKVNSPDNALHSGTSSFTVAAAAATPSLNSVSPTSYTADANNHSMQLLGSNFLSGDTLTFVDPQGNIFASNSSKLTFISGGEIDYQFNDGSDAGTWTVKVNSPDNALHSGTSSFTVAAAAATPSLNSVSPTSYTADANNHSMQLLGSNFLSGDTLTFVDPQGNIFASNSSKLTFISGGEIDYQFNDGSDAGTWTVKVNSPDNALHSGTSSFTVAGNVTPIPGVERGIDFKNAAAISASEIQSHGYNFAMNYIGTTSPNYLTASEANNYIQLGLGIVSIYEVTQRGGVDYDPKLGNSRYILNDLGYNNGVTDGQNAYNVAHNDLNQPADSAIYFAIDGDTAHSTALRTQVTEYFRGIDDGFNAASNGHPIYQVGIYGGGEALDDVYGLHYATLKWLASATGWAGPGSGDSSNYTSYDIKQGLQDTATFGSNRPVDPDVTTGSHFGQWGAAPAPAIATHNDIDRDGQSDVIFHNDNGSTAVWEMNGSQIKLASAVGTTMAGYDLVGTGDFDGDRQADLLFRDHNSGYVAMWEMNGANVKLAAGVGQLSPNFTVAGTGDFDGDGKADVLLRSDNYVAMWEMNGPTVKVEAGVGPLPAGYNIAGTGDFDGDGHSDILLRSDSAFVAIWEMNGATVKTAAGVGLLPAGYNIAGTGDFDGDGHSDILLRSNSGFLALLEMNGAAVKLAAGIGQLPTGYDIAGTGDVNGDGHTDILLRNTHGDVAVLEMNGATVQLAAGISSLTQDWHLIA